MIWHPFRVRSLGRPTSWRLAPPGYYLGPLAGSMEGGGGRLLAVRACHRQVPRRRAGMRVRAGPGPLTGRVGPGTLYPNLSCVTLSSRINSCWLVVAVKSLRVLSITARNASHVRRNPPVIESAKSNVISSS